MAGRTHLSLLQKFIDTLPTTTRNRLLKAIDRNEVSASLITGFAQAALHGSGAIGLRTFRKILIEALEGQPPFNESIIERFTAETANTEDDLLQGLSPDLTATIGHWKELLERADSCCRVGDSDDANKLLMLKEFDAADPRGSGVKTIRDGRVRPVEGSNWAEFLPRFKNMEPWSYSADQFPVSVPISYVQGTFDGATAAPGATIHFKRTAKGASQILLFKGLGHMPFNNLIRLTGDQSKWAPLQGLFKKLLSGERIGQGELNRLKNQYSDFNVAVASKNYAGSCHALF